MRLLREMAKKIEDVEAAATVTRVKIMDLHIAPRSSQTEHAKFSERCEDRAQESTHEVKTGSGQVEAFESRPP